MGRGRGGGAARVCREGWRKKKIASTRFRKRRPARRVRKASFRALHRTTSRRNYGLRPLGRSGLTSTWEARKRRFLGRDARVGTWRRARRDARSRTHLELAHERGFRVVVLVQGSALARERDAHPRRRAPRLVQKLTRSSVEGAFPPRARRATAPRRARGARLPRSPPARAGRGARSSGRARTAWPCARRSNARVVE